MNDYTIAVEAFLEAETWALAPQHAPAVASLRVLARELDLNFYVATASAFGVTYRQLYRERPGGESEAIAQALQ